MLNLHLNLFLYLSTPILWLLGWDPYSGLIILLGVVFLSSFFAYKVDIYRLIENSSLSWPICISMGAFL